MNALLPLVPPARPRRRPASPREGAGTRRVRVRLGPSPPFIFSFVARRLGALRRLVAPRPAKDWRVAHRAHRADDPRRLFRLVRHDPVHAVVGDAAYARLVVHGPRVDVSHILGAQTFRQRGLDHLALHGSHHPRALARAPLGVVSRGAPAPFERARPARSVYQLALERVDRVQARVADRAREVGHREPHARLRVFAQNLQHHVVALPPEHALQTTHPGLVHRGYGAQHGLAEPARRGDLLGSRRDPECLRVSFVSPKRVAFFLAKIVLLEVDGDLLQAASHHRRHRLRERRHGVPAAGHW
mmetsp:Transcript_4966/g.21092  ORF Transcript_4966/g.21092 Transcript_4966/m.21092 type:complete len:301 (-) Transcript_4966:327-1229(-)